jgi:hypothetical protein
MFSLCSESINMQLPLHVMYDRSSDNDDSVMISGKLVVHVLCTNIQGVSKRAFQWYFKSYCMASENVYT